MLIVKGVCCIMKNKEEGKFRQFTKDNEDLLIKCFGDKERAHQWLTRHSYSMCCMPMSLIVSDRGDKVKLFLEATAQGF